MDLSALTASSVCLHDARLFPSASLGEGLSFDSLQVSWRRQCFEERRRPGCGPLQALFMLELGFEVMSSMASHSFVLSQADFDGLPQSTPKKNAKNPKTTFTCPYCDKTYISKFYYDKHVETHTSQVLPSRASLINASQAIHLDVSNVSFSILGDENNNGNNPRPSFKVPSVPPPKKKTKPKTKPTLICTYCLKGYVCSRSYKSHVRTHAIQDAAARYLDKEKVMSNVQDISISALTHVANSPSSGDNGALFRQLVGLIISFSTTEEWKIFSSSLCAKLLDFLPNKKILLPLALLSSLYDSLECVLSDSDLCFDLLNTLNIQQEFSKDLKSQFFGEFSFNFTKEILSFISKSFHDSSPMRTQKPPVTLDADDRQVIYYIGGSIMRGYLRIGYRYKKSLTWEEIVEALKSKVLRDKATADQDASWTKAVDRGGLLYITSECQKFFTSLALIIYSSEKKDGSIDYEEVITKVSNSEVSVIWDYMISDALKEEKSLSLMNDVVRCFCRTCVRGFAKRRLNFLKQKPVISMPTRHAAARRKTK